MPGKSETGRIVVYTALFGNYDSLKEPAVIETGIDYVCFTDDKKLSSKHWTIHYIDVDQYGDSCRNAKIYKILPHLFFKKYDWSIWVDASIRIKKGLAELLKEQIGNTNLLFFVHPFRRCLYKEAQICLEAGTDQKDLVCRQVEKYKRSGMKGNYGLMAGGIIFRKHNEKEVILLMEKWWKEIVEGSRRD